MSLKSFNIVGSESSLIEYMSAIVEEMRTNTEKAKNLCTWKNTIAHVRRFAKPEMKIEELTPKWIERFKTYLRNVESHKGERCKSGSSPEKPIAERTINAYVGILLKVSTRAFNEGLIKDDVAHGTKRSKFSDDPEGYVCLSLEELRKLAITPCDDTTLKNAFMFSALTGLRKKDILTLEWKDVMEVEGMTRIIMKPDKKYQPEYVDINEQAVTYLSNKDISPEKPFYGFVESPRANAELKRWAMSAGINKNVTFKMARYTFIMIMLSIDTDIVVLSRIVGLPDPGWLRMFKENLTY